MSHCEIISSCRLHLQTVALCRCTEAMYLDLHHVYNTAEREMWLIQTKVDLCFVEFELIIIAFQ